MVWTSHKAVEHMVSGQQGLSARFGALVIKCLTGFRFAHLWHVFLFAGCLAQDTAPLQQAEVGKKRWRNWGSRKTRELDRMSALRSITGQGRERKKALLLAGVYKLVPVGQIRPRPLPVSEIKLCWRASTSFLPILPVATICYKCNVL